MKRKRSEKRIIQDALIIKRIHVIKAEHPLWGYRRIWAYMRYRNNIVIGKNRIYRLMKENNWLVLPSTKLKAKRCSNRKKPKPKIPNQYWGMDMTKIWIQSWGWVYLHLVLDWCTKQIIGWNLSTTSKTDDWLSALNQAVSNRFTNGILSVKGKPKLITDNGCQPTAKRFMEACSILKIKQIFTTWNNPKGNADTERIFRTIKEDLVWTREWHLPFQFQSDLANWIYNYNSDFPHQALNYKTPDQMANFFFNRKLLRKEAINRYSLKNA